MIDLIKVKLYDYFGVIYDVVCNDKKFYVGLYKPFYTKCFIAFLKDR